MGVGDCSYANYAELPVVGADGVGEAMMALWPAIEPKEAHSAALPVVTGRGISFRRRS